MLLGGETAEMPGVYSKGDYELAGFTVGIVERQRIIDGKTASKGNILIGLPSSGIHSNGLSLARRALFEVMKYDPHQVIQPLKHSLIDELLIPTKIYVSVVLDLIDHFQLKGIAHITGGGLYSNLKRVLPEGLDIMIDWESFETQPIFNLIQHAGEVDIEEMRNAFNMGVGMVFIVETVEADRVIAHLKGRGESVYVIGEVCA